MAEATDKYELRERFFEGHVPTITEKPTSGGYVDDQYVSSEEAEDLKKDVPAFVIRDTYRGLKFTRPNGEEWEFGYDPTRDVMYQRCRYGRPGP